MSLRKREFLLRRIKFTVCSAAWKKEDAKAEWVTGMFFLLFLAVVLCTQLQLSLYRTASDYLEDALAASNLASAVIDVEEYGISHTLRIADYEKAYERFQEAVKGNLNLDEDFLGKEEGVIAGRVRVVDYTIYDVEGEAVITWTVSEDGSRRITTCRLGDVKAPNGQPIEHTSVYSEITFPVKGFFGMQVEAHKGKLVDILADPEQG